MTAMFRSADTNRDGMITLDELHAIIAKRRETAVRARFDRIDHDHDGRIDMEEFSAWQETLGSLALSDARALGSGPSDLLPAAIEPELGKGPDERTLHRLVEPLDATVIAKANVNYDAGVTLDELLAYERGRFDSADTNHDGELTPDEARRGDDDDGRRGSERPFVGRQPDDYRDR